MINLVTSILSLVTAVISLLFVLVQRSFHDQEQKSYRQQLISLLHHAEGLRDSINSLGISVLTDNNDPAQSAIKMQLYQTIDSVKQNANALFFGIMETKVGGKQLLDDLDTKYKDWSSLELDRKIMAAKNLLRATKNFSMQSKNVTNGK